MSSIQNPTPPLCMYIMFLSLNLYISLMFYIFFFQKFDFPAPKCVSSHSLIDTRFEAFELAPCLPHGMAPNPPVLSNERQEITRVQYRNLLELARDKTEELVKILNNNPSPSYLSNPCNDLLQYVKSLEKCMFITFFVSF